jgi:transposase
MSMFIPYQSNPNLLLPTRLGDNIPKDDISWVIIEVAGQLDLTKIKFNYSYYGTEGLSSRYAAQTDLLRRGEG